jgi:dienelactone hydrolase
MTERATRAHDVFVEGRGVSLPGDVVLPERASGIVVFAHGSGSSRFSPRNRLVAERLCAAGLATLLFDLLTADEEVQDAKTRALRFDIPLLADRLTMAVDWIGADARLCRFPIGLFGASTGAAAALYAAARRPATVHAVVSRGGRPDLAAEVLQDVRADTLLIVGGLDEAVISMNHMALQRLKCRSRLEIVPGATHLFEEPGKLERVSDLARDWFLESLTRRRFSEAGGPSLRA